MTLLSVKGVFKEGAAYPVEGVRGREGQSVVIMFLEDELAEPETAEREAAWDVLTQLVENCAVETGIHDLAHQHDHYLYGKAKRE